MLGEGEEGGRVRGAGCGTALGCGSVQRVAVGNERFTSEIITRRFLQCKWEMQSNLFNTMR